jgi:hypothetical protein
MNIETDFKHEILTKKSFSALIEEKAVELKLNYIDTVLAICEERDLDPQDVSSLISNIIKTKIEAEAISLNKIKGGNTLPL